MRVCVRMDALDTLVVKQGKEDNKRDLREASPRARGTLDHPSDGQRHARADWHGPILWIDLLGKLPLFSFIIFIFSVIVEVNDATLFVVFQWPRNSRDR